MARITAELGGTNYAVAIVAGEHRLSGDEPVEHGGRNAGPSPYDLLLSGLAACTIITLRMYAERKGWDIGTIHAELVHSRRDKRSHVVRTLRFGNDLTEAQRAKLAEIAEKTPVTLTLKQGADIETHFHVPETAEHLEARLDEAIEESFPASDPLSVSRDPD